MPRVIVISLLILLAGCGGSAPEAGTPRVSTPTATPPPPAVAPLPRTPVGLAAAVSETTGDLEARISRWLRGSPAATERPPEAVALLALFQQRLYRHLRLHQQLAARVIAAMPPRLRRQARDNVVAGRSLFKLAPRKPPKTQPPIRIGRAEPPGRLLGWYRAAQRRFGVRWQLLAAINFVESGFNRLRNNSYAGAQGPMQFIPSTWRSYGLGGNVRDPHDAINGAANFLHASGAPANERRAVFSYNPSNLYVDAIMRYARQIQLKPERFYAYWSWQVFVRNKRRQAPA